MKKFILKIDNKKIAIVSTVLFFLSMIPIWYLSKYARPTGDDYGYSVLTHAAWLETRSLLKVFEAAAQTVKKMYLAWNGDWFTTFLFALMPEVFRPYTFWIVPFIMTGAMIAGTAIFCHEILVKVFKLPFEDFVIICSIILFLSYQYIPSTAIGMYWYVGATHYILPHSVGLLALVFASKYIRTGKMRYIIYSTLCTFMVGGSSYFTSLLIFMVYTIILIFFTKKNKKIFLLFIPFLVCLVGFVIQCKSPGNIARGGEQFGFHWNMAIETIFMSLQRGLYTIFEYWQDKKLVFILLIVIGMFGWEMMRKCKITLKYPAIFVIFMYGFYAAMFAPEIYSAVDVSDGPATIEYFTFLLTVTASILYCEGWIHQKINKSEEDTGKNYRLKILFPSIFILGIIVVWNRSWLSNSTDMQVYEYIVSGQADDFKEQIDSQMEILLDDSIKEAYLCPINDEQGPLLHMPITGNENDFTNRVVRDFYGKDKVVMVVE